MRRRLYRIKRQVAVPENTIRRVRVPERMDSPDIGEAEHLHALRGLARLNALSGGARSMWPAVRKLAASARTPLSVIDVATGSGDIPLDLAGRARRAGIELDWSVCDISERAVAQATERMTAAGFPCQGHTRNILSEPLPARYDIVLCSLFLHHLDPPDVRRALSAMGASTRKLLLINDLRRSRAGLAMAMGVPKLVTTSRVVWFDAAASVRAAYTKTELSDLAAAAGLNRAHVLNAWPQRMVLSWEPS